ncbi:Uncharacterised protein [Klebsiella pneumoniae]|nr:Uncharacterised protein [Klebsiella pneumoniae]SCA00242.1 Uncharacterised protein [Klebsiella pneumoniae]SVJ78593.1 Uncharacterised protein [Klebsiella pneumoniae]
MIVILVAGHHAGRDLLAHVTHLSVNHKQGVLLDLNTGLESGNLHTRLVEIFHDHIHCRLGIITG